MIPEEQSVLVILPLLQKRDRRVCGNYRGISLIDVAAMIQT